MKTNKTLEEVHVGNLMVGCTMRLKNSGEEKLVTETTETGSAGVIKFAGASQWVTVGNFEPIAAVLPAKQLRDNTIETLNLSNKGLGVDGGLMLAALMAGNS